MTQTDNEEAVLRVDGLSVVTAEHGSPIVNDLGFELAAGHLLGVVGESGSGKTTVALSCLGYLRGGMRIGAGSVSVDGVDVASPDVRTVAGRGSVVSYVPQSAGFALNPALRLRTQFLSRGGSTLPTVTESALLDAFRQVGLPADGEFLRRYPHQLSGGQQQRVLIAVALLSDPSLVVLDEPTTGLDVTTQTQILSLIRELCSNRRVAGLFVSHDISAVAQLCDQVAVMYDGRIVEIGSVRDVLASPRHPYTAGLLAAVPDISGERRIASMPRRATDGAPVQGGCPFAPRCRHATERCRVEEPAAHRIGDTGTVVRCHFPLLEQSEHNDRGGILDVSHRSVEGTPRPVDMTSRTAPLLEVTDLAALYGRRRVLEGINLHVVEGSCTAVVGESGSGKSTLSRSIIGLHHHWSGEVKYNGSVLARSAGQRSDGERAELQYIFQNPYDALNPRRTIADVLSQPLSMRGLERSKRPARIRDLLDMVELSPAMAARYPTQLSGGELQRVAIARALATEPRILLCDEVTSALDVSVQASIAKLLARLQADMGLTLLFVTHNIGLVRQIADAVVVMKDGRVCESASTAQLFARPRAAYTAQLLADVPDLWRKVEEWRSEDRAVAHE
jgi:peptide/nickel transport system ATP-binding protein